MGECCAPTMIDLTSSPKNQTDQYSAPMIIDLTSSPIRDSSSEPPTPPSKDINPVSLERVYAVAAVEKILNYQFRNKGLLEEALTHCSGSETVSYQRLEFVGDAALGLMVSNHVFTTYPTLYPGMLSKIRAANISTEKLARVAVKHGFYRYVKCHSFALDKKVAEFGNAVFAEEHPSVYGKIRKAPKVLADIVESIVAAVYVDVGYDLHRLWGIFRVLLEPIITAEDLEKQPQPVTLLYEWCHKQRKKVEFRFGSITVGGASVYVDDELVSTSSSLQRNIAKLEAANGALLKLTDSIPTDLKMMGLLKGVDDAFEIEIEGAKQKLNEICVKKRWAKPRYKVEQQEGPSHDRKFVCSVQLTIGEDINCMMGDQKPKVKESENSAASSMIRALQKSNYL